MQDFPPSPGVSPRIMAEAGKRWGWTAAALLLLAFGLAVRLWHVFGEPLWLDEAYSAYAADHGFTFLWQVVPRYETHPPFYYSLLHLWVLVAGDSVAALRAPGVLAGLATLLVMTLTAREAGRRLGWERDRRHRLMLAVLALACCSIPLVEMARQVRPYPLMILVYAAALSRLLQLAEDARAGRPLGRGLLGYFLLLEAMLWLHNMGPLFGVALTLALACAVVRRGMSRRDWIRLGVGHLLVGLAYLPGFLILLGQAPTWAASTWVQFQWPDVIGRVQMLYAVAGLPIIVAIGLAVLGIATLVRAKRNGRVAAILLILALLPLVLSITLSLTVAPVFITRTMTPVAVPALLLFAIGAAGATGALRWLGLGGVLLICATTGAIDVQTRMGGPMQDWYQTVDWLRRWAQPGDQVFAYPNEGDLPLSYALRDKRLALPIRAIPAPVPAFADYGGWYPTGSRGVVSLPPARLRAIAEEPATQAVPTIWLLRLGKQTYDRGDILLHELHRGRYVVRHWQAGPIDIVGLRRLPADARPFRSPTEPARNPR